MRGRMFPDVLDQLLWFVNLHEKSLFLRRVVRQKDRSIGSLLRFLSDLRPVRDTSHCDMQIDQARSAITAR